MPVTVIFECGGCHKKAEGTNRLRREFRSVSGRSYGIGGTIESNSIEDITPEGWTAFDPWTYCTYCPTCMACVRGEITEEECERLLARGETK